METLNLIEQLLARDLEEYVPRIVPKSSIKKQVSKNDPFEQQDFFRYLVSVASHPIGLCASVKPFNSKEDEMLNYLVDMFDIKDFGRLKNILMSYRDSEAKKDRVDPRKLTEIIRSRRRHSWRPELRIRIKPPTFYYRERHYIDNLNVRVYLFRDDETCGPEEPEDDPTQGSKNQRTVLKSIFKTSKIELSNRIRPVNEMRCQVNFERIGTANEDYPGSKADYKMVRVSNGEKIYGDIRLKIRRRYCEPGSKYILRFEFWLNSEAVEANWVDQYRRYLKRFVYNGASSCSGKGKSVYQNEDQEFYGYVNYKLDQLPSHAIKLDRPISTLQNRKINNCEICIEARNRRLETDDKGTAELAVAQSARVVMNEDFIVNHIRLYANCFLYQSLKLIKNKGESLVDSYAMENVTIDSLFYMSAQTLVNQHRLQSNLDKFEDQSLRRIAFLLLVNGLQFKFGGYEKEANMMLNLLISLTNHEYVMARNVIDDKTLQELDPFHGQGPNHTSDLIVEMEMTVLNRFAVRTLQDRVEKFFLPMRQKNNLNRTVTLTGLTMFKRALAHHEKLGQIHVKVKNIRFDVAQMRVFISEILYDLIEKHLRKRFESLLRRNSRTADRGEIKDSETDSWPTLLRDIGGLSNDLYLYWSSEGMRKLEEQVPKKIDLIGSAEKQNLRKLIKLKIDDFLD